MNQDQSERAASAEIPSASRPILLAEDDPNDAEFFRHAYRKGGFQNPLFEVRTGDEVINYLLGEGLYADRARFPLPHLLLLDSKLPGKSGSGSPNDEDTAFRLGAMGYHVKPGTIQELEHLVKRICGNWQLPGSVP